MCYRLFMLLVRLLVNRRLLVISPGAVNSCVDFRLRRGVAIPNPHVVQGSAVVLFPPHDPEGEKRGSCFIVTLFLIHQNNLKLRKEQFQCILDYNYYIYQWVFSNFKRNVFMIGKLGDSKI